MRNKIIFFLLKTLVIFISNFLITLMTKDYAKTYDIGNQLLKNNSSNIDVIRALRILRHRERGKIKQWNTLNPIDSHDGSECEGNDGSTECVDDNMNIHLDPIIGSKNTLHDIFRLSNNVNNSRTNLDYKPKMHRVIQIKMDDKTIPKMFADALKK